MLFNLEAKKMFGLATVSVATRAVNSHALIFSIEFEFTEILQAEFEFSNFYRVYVEFKQFLSGLR